MIMILCAEYNSRASSGVSVSRIWVGFQEEGINLGLGE